MTPTVEDVLEQYKILCEWSDRFFLGVQEKMGDHMQCGAGCWFCCTMKSALPIEAHFIREYLADLEPDEIPSSIREPKCPDCLLLVDKKCFIYPARPSICRTHGVPMRHGEDSNVGSCLMNFEDVELESLEPELILDEQRRTENLVRLNAAYCQLNGIDDSPQSRVTFKELLEEAHARHGNVGR